MITHPLQSYCLNLNGFNVDAVTHDAKMKIGRLYCLPMDKVQPWFVQDELRFEERCTSTPTKRGEGYVTIGRLVPIITVLEEVDGVLQFQKQG